MFQLATVDELRASRSEIVEAVLQRGFAVVRGLFDRRELREKLEKLYDAVNQSERLPTSGVAPDAVQANVVKWSIGGDSTTQRGLPRMMITAYNPVFAQDLYGLRSSFSRLIEIRDALAQRDTLTDARLAPDRWNGCRIQIYPAGGGFMGAHVDSRAKENLPPDTTDYIQLILLLTERGLDYTTGGAFVRHGDDVFDTERGTKTGDVVIYNGNTLHGVADIDPGEVLRDDDLRGRAVALATIYDKH